MNNNSATTLAPGREVRFFWRNLLLVLVVACAIFFTNLGEAQLWDRDEPRNAGCAAEMMDRGDWVVPIFNGELRGQKPVLLYWLMMSAYQVFGVNEFSARFWSALLGVGTVAVTFSISHRLFGSRVALISGIILASNLMFGVAARAATPDSVLIFFSTLTIAFYIWGSRHTPEDGFVRSFCRLRWQLLLAMGISLGLAMLAKGPIGYLMPMAIMGMHLLILRRDRSSKGFAFFSVVNPVHFLKTTVAMHPFLLLAIGLLVAMPWYYQVAIKTEGDFLNLFFLKEHIGRSTTSFENHSGGFWYYPLSILVGFFPWSLFWLPVAIIVYRYQRTQTNGNEGVSLMLCWIGVQVGIFSLVQTKLPSYVTPCYPALSILTAVGLEAWVQKRVTFSDTWIQAALITGVVIGFVLAVVLAGASNHYALNAFWLPVVGAAVAGACVVGFWKLASDDRSATVNSFAIGALIFSWALFGFGTGSLSTAQNNRLILDRVAEMPPDVAVASYQCLESSWPFYSKRTIYETFGDASAVLVTRTRPWKPKPFTTPESFADQHEQCVFITSDEFADELMSRLPDGFEIRQTADYFFKNKKLVLIGQK